MRKMNLFSWVKLEFDQGGFPEENFLYDDIEKTRLINGKKEKLT